MYHVYPMPAPVNPWKYRRLMKRPKDMSQRDFERMQNEMEIDYLRWEVAAENAEDIVRSNGWSEEDDDFDIQLEMETRRQWEEEMDREEERRI